jgi:FemAB-related protein (PEP-CTERM system-associated)
LRFGEDFAGNGMTEPFDFKICGPADGKAWQSLATSGGAHHAFDWRWRHIVESSFCHKPYYLLLQDKGEAVAICPMFLVNSPLFGKALISVPYLNSGGILSRSEPARSALLAQIERLAENLQVPRVELRSGTAWPESGAWVERAHKITLKRALLETEEAMFASFPSKLRSQVRRSAKLGVTVRSVVGTEVVSRDVEDFYSVFSRNMRDLGTPVYPRALFENTLAEFGNKSRLIIASIEGSPVAAGLTIGAGETVEIPWASSLRDFNHLSPNMLMYWECLRLAISDGYRIFDFGRSTPDSAPHRFKAQWGAVPETLTWHYRVRDVEMPEVDPAKTSFSLAVRVWRKLPLVLANGVGPYITRWLP